MTDPIDQVEIKFTTSTKGLISQARKQVADLNTTLQLIQRDGIKVEIYESKLGDEVQSEKFVEVLYFKQL